MDVREKMVELLREAPYNIFDNKLKGMLFDSYLALIADHLIANGVTVLPVQVGDTVYGRFLPYGEGVQQCEVVKSKLCQFKDGTVRYLLDLEFNIIDPYFNDSRLMRCRTHAVYGADFGN